MEHRNHAHRGDHELATRWDLLVLLAAMLATLLVVVTPWP